MQRTWAEKLRRCAGVAGWLLACEAMILFGTVQGTEGSWVCGAGLYSIMAREWPDNDRRRNIRRHAATTAGVISVGIGTEFALLLDGAAGLTLAWEQVPLATILCGALYNYAHAPPIGAKQQADRPGRER